MPTAMMKFKRLLPLLVPLKEEWYSAYTLGMPASRLTTWKDNPDERSDRNKGVAQHPFAPHISKCHTPNHEGCPRVARKHNCASALRM